MKKDSWNPQQYEKYKNERSQPFFDLAEMIRTEPAIKNTLDLGCGSGELTARLPTLIGTQKVLGIDTSDKMLEKAWTLQSEFLEFKNAPIESVSELGKFDVIFSNAAIQWCPHHTEIFSKIKSSLNPHGQIAIQMPMNHDYPTHTLSSQMSREPRWLNLLNGETYDKSQSILSPEKYAQLLFDLGFKEQKVMQRVYGHVMDSREDVISWVQGSMLTFFQSRLSPTDFAQFTQEYQERLFKILPDNRPFFYPFKRIFIWARL